MKLDANDIIGSYLRENNTVFTSDEFVSFLKNYGIKISKEQADELLHSSDYVFPLVGNKFITRAGVFLGKFFSFKLSKEEIEAGRFVIGHRCMPFTNPDINPDSIVVFSNKKKLKSEPFKFSMNFALDRFALYGEGYALPYVVSDAGNEEINLSSVTYSMPSSISLMSWSISDLKGGKDVEYGDRVICRVVDWESSSVEMSLVHEENSNLVITQDDIERENWYSDFETGILESLERHGPTASIEEQLALLYLENIDKLCIQNSGSIEEFLAHTSKIDFEPYGVETRIWKTGEVVPYIGPWNELIGKNQLIFDLAVIFTPEVVDSYVKNSLFKGKGKNHGKIEILDELLEEIMPKILPVSSEKRNTILLNIKKRRDILSRNYNSFVDYTIAEIRERTLTLFSKVCSLVCSVGFSNCDIKELPQQELVILSQLYGHLVRMIDELESGLNYSQFPIDDVTLSLDGMEDTFEEIYTVLESAIDANTIKGFEIISDDSKN